MARVSTKNFLILSQRAYTVASAASSTRKVSDASKEITGGQNEVFWMRDPKTGYWIPENHFDKMDAAELRDKFLSKKDKL